MKKTAFVLAASVAVLLSACGQQQSEAPEAPKAAAPAPAPVQAPAPAPAVPANAAGASVYNKTCALCHAAGVAGAPKPGDQAEWAPRIAQGKDILYKHSLEGFTGEKGNMPARGGASTLTDDEVKSAVDYMVDKSS